MAHQPPAPLVLPDGRPLHVAAENFRDGEGLALPPVFSFAAVIGGASKTYYHDRFDEAMRHSRENALAMRRDAFLMSLLQERKMAVSSLPWYLETPDPKDRLQAKVRGVLTQCLRGTRGLRRMILSWLEAIWYGRYGNQFSWRWQEVEGRRTLSVDRWAPINGDKIGYHWDGTPYVLVNAAKAANLPGVVLTNTTRARALSLLGGWRDRFVIHQHEIDDADYFEAEAGDGRHGVGVRSRVYWLDFLKREYLDWVVTYLERVGLGTTLWKYDASSPEQKAKAEEAARDNSRRVNITVPVWPDRAGGYSGGVERIEAPMGGVEALRTMIEAMDQYIERFIIGQAGSSQSQSSGLGNEAASEFMSSTKDAIRDHDAHLLAETITGSDQDPGLLSLMQRYSFPETTADRPNGFPVLFKFGLEKSLNNQRVQTITQVSQMGLPVRKDDIYNAAGLSRPEPHDDVLEPQQQGGPGGAGGNPLAAMMGGGGGPPGGDVPPDGGGGEDAPASEEDVDSFLSELFGDDSPDDDGAGGEPEEDRASEEDVDGFLGELFGEGEEDDQPRQMARQGRGVEQYGWKEAPEYAGKSKKWIGTDEDEGKKPRYQQTKPGSGRSRSDEGKPAQAKKGKADPERARVALARLKAEGDSPEVRDELRQALDGLTVPQLDELRREFGIRGGGTRKADKQAALAGHKPGEVPAKKPASREKKQGIPAEPVPGKVYNAKVDALAVDPTRFQYKLNTNNPAGVTDEMKQVRTWNPDFAGVVSVWKDPANGKTYVVNGHHRHELASRLGAKDMAVRYVKAATAKEARAVGALINIAEGRGTAVDAAKFLRDSGMGIDDLDGIGVSLKGKVAADAGALTRLNDRLFDRIARGLMSESQGLAIGRHLGDPDLQDQLVSLIEKRQAAKKETGIQLIEEMAREMAATPTTSKTERSLFGDIESTESLFVPRNELKAHIRNELAREVGDFMAVASKRRAKRVAGAGNTLDVERNREIAEQAEGAKRAFDMLVNRKGDISNALNASAETYSKAKTKKEKERARQQAFEAVREAVFAEAGIDPTERGGEAGSTGGGAGGSPGAAIPEAEQSGGGHPATAGLSDHASKAMERFDNRGSLRGESGSLFGGDDLRSRQMFGKLPDGTPVVVGDGQHRGKTGKIRREKSLDGSERLTLQLDGEDTTTPVAHDAVEPLNDLLSWRTEFGSGGRKQAGVFDNAPYNPHGARKPAAYHARINPVLPAPRRPLRYGWEMTKELGDGRKRWKGTEEDKGKYRTQKIKPGTRVKSSGDNRRSIGEHIDTLLESPESFTPEHRDDLRAKLLTLTRDQFATLRSQFGIRKQGRRKEDEINTLIEGVEGKKKSAPQEDKMEAHRKALLEKAKAHDANRGGDAAPTISPVKIPGMEWMDNGGDEESGRTEEERMAGETLDDAMARKVGYQIENGLVKLSVNHDGWQARVTSPTGKPYTFGATDKKDVIAQVFSHFYPKVALVPSRSERKGPDPRAGRNREGLGGAKVPEKQPPVWTQENVKRERGQLGEISGLQASKTSRRQLDRLTQRADDAMDRRRIGSGWSVYAQEVIKAYEQGEVDEGTKGIHPDAARVIRAYKEESQRQAKKESEGDLRAWSNVSADDLKPGDVVYTALPDPCRVVKVNQKSVTVQRPDGSKFNTQAWTLSRMHDSDLRAAVAAIQAGDPIPPEVLGKYPDLASQHGPQE